MAQSPHTGGKRGIVPDFGQLELPAAHRYTTAPISPKEFVDMVNPMMMGWVNYFRHTNASQAFRGLQRFVNIRFRRYLTQRSKGRGFGWKRFPNSKLYAMGLVYIGSGMLEYTAKPAHGVR
jgi:RNA-directed DNA polymerase